MKNNLMVLALTVSGALGASTQLFSKNSQIFFTVFIGVFIASSIYFMKGKNFTERLITILMIAGFFFIGAVAGRLVAG